MKIIKINESQKNRLFEAYQEGFSFEVLSMIGDEAIYNEKGNESQVRYCTKWLGNPFSEGSSRMVFQLDDNFLLKLAYGRLFNAGVAQNRVEYDIYHEIKSPLLVRTPYCDEKYTYLVCESVVPAKEEDFEKILGIPFFGRFRQNSIQNRDFDSPNGGDVEIGFNKYFDNIRNIDEVYRGISFQEIVWYMQDRYSVGTDIFHQGIESLINSTPWLYEFRSLLKRTKIQDLGQVGNFGIVNREGEPMIVILDSGFNQYIYWKYYR